MGDVARWPSAVHRTLAVLTKSELLLPLIGGIYVVEAASVIIQVGSFKLNREAGLSRWRRCTHHYEIKGWAEPKIIVPVLDRVLHARVAGAHHSQAPLG